MDKINIFWFRRDLRLNDNPGLYYALSENLEVLPVFIFDTNILKDLDDKNDSRVSFIYDQIGVLKDSLNKLGSDIQVLVGNPFEHFNELTKKYKVNAVFANRDYEPYGVNRDAEIDDFLKNRGVDFYTFKDHVVFEKGEILTKSETPFKVFTAYKNLWYHKIRNVSLENFESENLLFNLYKTDKFKIPTLEELGFRRSLIRVPEFNISKELLRNYEEKRDFPAIAGTSRLGVHLRFGTVSIRSVTRIGLEYSQTWVNELIWREFYMMLLAYFPDTTNKSFKAQFERVKWVNDEFQFKKWCDGETGYPLVDAGMRELNATGYMHNRVRMIVASFLTKHLLIDWRWGERYFAKKLLDFELSSNVGGWQWAAGVGTDAQPYFRVFNPYSQQEKFDNRSEYIKEWVPEWNTPAYIHPIIDHKYARQRAIETYKEATT